MRLLIVGAVVVAAGNSERMGKNKLLLPLGNKLLLEGILAALTTANISQQVVVLGSNEKQTREALKGKLGTMKAVTNPNPERGMTSSFQIGLAMLTQVDAAFLVLGDEPILNANLLTQMVDVLAKNSKVAIVSPIYKKKKGHPVLFHNRVFREIMKLANAETLRNIVHAHKNELFTVEAENWTVMDIDTPLDYENYCKLMQTKRLT